MRRMVWVLGALAVGCGGPVTSPDGGRDASVSVPDSGLPCARDQDCDDQRFCTGVERCMPGAAEARANGCVLGAAPCAEDETCDEIASRCEGEACDEPDADHDGYDSEACGGDDCDDADPSRHPDNDEVCDPDHHDEDCDPTTFGIRDEDGDGFPDSRCCNMGVTLSCGTDCDDAVSSIHPTAAERCDGLGVDEDCDSRVDEGERVDCYPDEDDDGYAATGSAAGAVCRDATRIMRGGCPPGFTNRLPADAASTDCDDTRLDRSPAAIELCNGQDDDCDGMNDDGYLCAAGATQACTTNPSCGGLSGTQRCAPTCESWGPCALPDEGPAVAGTCNGCDDDLDGAIDDNFACQRGTTMAGCATSCGTTGSRLCAANCTFDSCRAVEECNYCDDDADGILTTDELALVVPSQAFDGDPVNVDSMPVQGFGAIGAGYLHSGASSIGILEITRDVTVGYGLLSFSAQVNIVASSIPQQGWAIWMYSPAAGTRGTPAASSYGAPWDRNGFSGEWAFNGTSTDGARLIALRTSATEVAIESGTISGGTASSAQMELRVTPDNPSTPADETRVELYAGPTGAMIREAFCDTDTGTSCRHRIQPGTRWRFGISHVSGAAGATATSMSLSGSAMDVVVASACAM